MPAPQHGDELRRDRQQLLGPHRGGLPVGAAAVVLDANPEKPHHFHSFRMG